MTNVFKFLDKYYVKHNKLDIISQTALNKFKEKVFNNYASKLVKTILDLIDNDREDRENRIELIQKVLNCYIVMGRKVTRI